jgi:uncharacterized membrane-anchored protein
MNESISRYLPDDDLQREVLHDEIHTRPSATFKLPALIVYVAVLNKSVTTAMELAHLQQLPGHANLSLDSLKGNFLQLQCGDYKVIWERHTEFTRYTISQPLPVHAQWGSTLPALTPYVATGPDWLRGIPGKTITAIHLAMLNEGMDDPDAFFKARQWLGEGTVIGSKMGRTANNASHSYLMTHLRIGADGFERILVLAAPDTSENRSGRIAQRLLELETYRMMSLLSLPLAKSMSGKLTQSELQLVDINDRLEKKLAQDQQLLDDLAALAAQVESTTAENSYRFSASRAYDAIVQQRISEMREQPLSGMQTVGEFMQRRLAPAMATVNATSARLSALAERVARANDLLRTRVDIATESHNQLLLERLTKGQATQLRLQTTVEGLSIAAISYYVVSLTLYLGKAIQAAGIVNLSPEMLAGFSTPLVLFLCWRMVQKIHRSLNDE